jgi:hypothetical protein
MKRNEPMLQNLQLKRIHVRLWCKKQYGAIEAGRSDTKSLLDGKPLASHGICPDCYPIMEAQVDAALSKLKGRK